MFAAALQARRKAHDFVLLESGRREHGDDARLSLGERPVLSTTIVSTRLQRLEGTRVLEEDAHRGAAATPTMIDMGVARPSAHGHAMMRTATAFTSAWARRGSGPARAQTTKVTRPPDHRRDEDGGHAIREPLDRRAASLRLADETDDLGEKRVAAHALGLHQQAARSVDRAPGDRGTERLEHRQRFPVIIDSSTALSPKHRAVAGHALAGTDSQPVPRLHLIERDFFLAAVGADPSRGLRRELEERADGVPVRLRARSSRTCPSRTRTVMVAAASKYTPTAPSIPRSEAGKSGARRSRRR